MTCLSQISANTLFLLVSFMMLVLLLASQLFPLLLWVSLLLWCCYCLWCCHFCCCYRPCICWHPWCSWWCFTYCTEQWDILDYPKGTVFFWYRTIGLCNIELVKSRNYRTIGYRTKALIYRTLWYRTCKNYRLPMPSSAWNIISLKKWS